MNYAFYLLTNWSFLYLLQVRHLAALESSVLAAFPPSEQPWAPGSVARSLIDSPCAMELAGDTALSRWQRCLWWGR